MNNFAVLVGVALTDNEPTDAGNFGGVEGSHRKYARYFEEYGVSAVEPKV